MSLGKMAAPRPETARMNPASRAVGERRSKRPKVAGKNGARLSPSKMHQPGDEDEGEHQREPLDERFAVVAQGHGGERSARGKCGPE